MGGRVLHFLVAALAVGGLAAIGADRASPGAGAADAEGGIFRITINAASGIDSMDPACRGPSAARGRGRLPVDLERPQELYVPLAQRLPVQ